jgi:hypothetical protein
MNKNYKYNNIVRNIDSISENPFKNLVNNIGLTIQKIAKMEDKCVLNENEVNKRFRKSIGIDSDISDNIITEESFDNDVFGDLIPSNTPNIELSSNLIEHNQDFTEMENKLISKIYKLIALNCHPDKTSDPIKNNIFIYATESKRNMDIIQSIYLISKTDIPELNLNHDELSFIENKLNELDAYINHLTNSVFYKWNDLNEFQQEQIINTLKKINNIT